MPKRAIRIPRRWEKSRVPDSPDDSECPALWTRETTSPPTLASPEETLLVPVLPPLLSEYQLPRKPLVHQPTSPNFLNSSAGPTVVVIGVNKDVFRSGN